jgi:hypothetical protein
MKEYKKITESEMLEALEKADELYKQYREQQEIIDVAVSCNSSEVDNGHRDINHPLSVILS